MVNILQGFDLPLHYVTESPQYYSKGYVTIVLEKI